LSLEITEAISRNFCRRLGRLLESLAGTLIVAIHNASGVHAPILKRKPDAEGAYSLAHLQEEWRKLQKALLAESPLLEQAARFTLATGLRENNVLELEWSQVDLGRRVAWFYADQMKGRVEHGIPLNDAALAVLRERKGIHKRWVFGNPDYPLYKASNRAWYNALRKSKLKANRGGVAYPAAHLGELGGNERREAGGVDEIGRLEDLQHGSSVRPSSPGTHGGSSLKGPPGVTKTS
jgi:hypothetical protein